MKLGELAARLGCAIEGDSQIEIQGVAGIEDAGPGDVTFLSNRKYSRALRTTLASGVFVSGETTIERDAGLPALAAIRSGNPYLDFARAIAFFYSPPAYAPGIHPTAIVAPSAKIGEGAHIGPYCFIDEGAQIGRHAVLHSFVTIYRNAHIGDDFLAHSQAVVREDCRIGHRVTIQNGVVIGSDGFGFAKQSDGRWHKIPQQAPVIIEDDVEIQANACVDRATVGETRVHRGAKIDDLVLVGHACDVGEDAILCGQVGLAGSTRVGNRAILAGNSGSAGHIEIGDDAVVTAKSGIHTDIPAGAIFSGYPAMESKAYLRIQAALKRLPEMQKQLRELAEEVAQLKAQSAKK